MIISGNKTQISRRDFHIIHSVHCELDYKFYQHQQMRYSGYSVFNINLLLLFRRDRHLQGAYTKVVKNTAINSQQ